MLLLAAFLVVSVRAASNGILKYWCAPKCRVVSQVSHRKPFSRGVVRAAFFFVRLVALAQLVAAPLGQKSAGAICSLGTLKGQ